MTIKDRNGKEMKGQDLVDTLREIATHNHAKLAVDKYHCLSHTIARTEGYKEHPCYNCNTSKQYLDCVSYLPNGQDLRRYDVK